jgi:hypothetical protein
LIVAVLAVPAMARYSSTPSAVAGRSVWKWVVSQTFGRSSVDVGCCNHARGLRALHVGEGTLSSLANRRWVDFRRISDLPAVALSVDLDSRLLQPGRVSP